MPDESKITGTTEMNTSGVSRRSFLSRVCKAGLVLPMFPLTLYQEAQMISTQKRKTIGIIGGIGPESTIDYYRLIIKKFKQRDPNGNPPSIILNSINLKQTIQYMNDKNYDGLETYLIGEIRRVEHADADIGIIAANTPHIIFDRVKSGVDLPLISIVEATCKEIRKVGMSRVGLLGTSFTMQGDFYQKAGKQMGIDIMIPDEQGQKFVHEKYMNELLAGIIHDETKSQLKEIIATLKNTQNIEGVVLGGTELSLILKQEDLPGFKVFDTTEIHVASVIDHVFS